MKIRLFFCFALLLTLQLFPQDIQIVNVDTRINTIGTLSVNYEITFNAAIDVQKTASSIENTNLFVKREVDDLEVEGLKIQKQLNDRFIRLKIIISGDMVNAIAEDLFSEENPVYISSDSDMQIYFDTAGASYTITRAMLQQITNSANTLTEAKKQYFLESLKNDPPSNRMNISFSSTLNNEDSLNSEYIATFDVQKPVFSSIINSPFYYVLKGRISTVAQNPLNTIEIYLKYRVREYLFVEGGRLGPQQFDRNSLRFNAGFEGLMPNFIDLTGGSNRLRLKPIIKAGVGLQNDFYDESLLEDAKANFLFFLEGYYYIPILQKFVLIAEGKVSYSKKLLTHKHYVASYSLTFGYETPLKDLSVLFKLTSGNNEINAAKTVSGSIGIMVNFLGF